MIINIQMHKIYNVLQLINEFQNVYNVLRTNERVDIILDCEYCHFISPDLLAAIVGYVNFLEKNGIKYYIEVNNATEDINRYMSRIDFYEHVNIDNIEDFTRWDSTGRFVEITNFDGNNNVRVTNDIIKVIDRNCCIQQNTLKCLNYCFHEMLDNVDIHADSSIGGYTVVQNYPRMNQLKILILDKGKGIYESLVKTEGSKYNYLTRDEALEFCIKEKVTNGKGMGNGLFHTSEFIKANGGQMMLISGEKFLNIINGNVETFEGPYWQGTLIYININTDKSVELKTIFGSNIPDTVENMEDYLYGDFALW